MYAVEFETCIKDSIIKLPNEYKELDGKNVKIIILENSKAIEEVDDTEQEYFEKLISNMSEDDKKIASKEIVDI